jgi:hypothetical protein
MLIEYELNIYNIRQLSLQCQWKMLTNIATYVYNVAVGGIYL